MFSLIIVVISIGLLAALATATLNYTPIDSYVRQAMQVDAIRGVQSLERAVTRYLQANRGSDGNILYPGDGVNIAGAVTPYYGFMPAPVRQELTWEVTTGPVSGLAAVGICLRPITASTPMQREVLTRIKSQLPVGSAYLGNACNATSDAPGGGALTFWVPLMHVN